MAETVLPFLTNQFTTVVYPKTMPFFILVSKRCRLIITIFFYLPGDEIDDMIGVTNLSNEIGWIQTFDPNVVKEYLL